MTVDRNTKFVVLTTQRSGSTWLISILNQLPETTAYGEIFLHRRRPKDTKKKYGTTERDHPRFIETQPQGFHLRPLRLFNYLDELYNQPGAVGFKLMYSQLRLYPEIVAYLVWHRLPVVHLVRNNFLDVLISHQLKDQVAAQRGRAHILIGQPQPDKMQTTLNTHDLIERLQDLQNNQRTIRKFLRWCQLPHMEISYEDLVANPHDFELIWDFLAINSQGYLPKSNLLKIRQGDHEDVISNYQQVKETLASSAFAQLLN